MINVYFCNSINSYLIQIHVSKALRICIMLKWCVIKGFHFSSHRSALGLCLKNALLICFYISYHLLWTSNVN